MHHGLHRFGNTPHHPGMLMAQRRSHLAGLEVEILAAVGVDHDRAGRSREDWLFLQPTHVTRSHGGYHRPCHDIAGRLSIHGRSPVWGLNIVCLNMIFAGVNTLVSIPEFSTVDGVA